MENCPTIRRWAEGYNQDLAFRCWGSSIYGKNLVATVRKAALDWKAFTIGSKVDRKRCGVSEQQQMGRWLAEDSQKGERQPICRPRCTRVAKPSALHACSYRGDRQRGSPIDRHLLSSWRLPPVVMTTEQVQKTEWSS